MNIRVPIAAPAMERWCEDNAAFIDVALDWVAARAAGQDGTAARMAMATLRADLRAALMPTALDQLSDRLGLSAFDEDALLLALAPDLDGGIAAAYAALSGRSGSSGLTVLLLARLLFGGERLPLGALARLATTAPLLWFALVHIDEGAPLSVAGLGLPALVRGRLCGEIVDPAGALGATRLPLVAMPERLERLADTLALHGEGLAIQLVGPAHSGRAALAAAVAQRLGRSAWTIPTGVDAATVRRELVLGEALGVFGAPVVGLATPMVVLATVPQGELAVVRLPPLNPDERFALWSDARPGLPGGEVLALGEQFALGPEAIAALDAGDDEVWAAARALAAPQLEGLATRIVPRRRLDDMVLADETRAQLMALVAQARHRGQVLGDWGYRRLLGAATGCAVLFAGPSGVGKTMAAEAVAEALGLDLWVVDLAQVTSKFIGETEKNLRALFDAAEAGGALLFFDEADALFGKRSEVKDAHDRYANQEVSYLLQRMEQHPGMAILATNLKGNLDTAFLRRLRMMVDFALPDAAARADLWRRALPEAMPQQGVDIARLARLELAGGAIMTIASNAAFAAAARGGPLAMGDLMAAAMAEFRKLDRDLAELVW